MRIPQITVLPGKSPARWARLRRCAVGGMLAASVLALGITGAGPLPAHAATTRDSSAGFAATATSYQNKVLNAAIARAAGGTRVSASEVEWDGGRIILGVSAAGTSAAAAPSITPNTTAEYNIPSDSTPLSCTTGYFCAWGTTNAQGYCWMYIEFDISGSFLDWGQYSSDFCGAVGTWSWENMTSDRVWKEQYYNNATQVGSYVWADGTPSGNNWCISPGVSNKDVTDETTRTLGWIQMTSNTSKC
jgi:hypothetical protein